MFHNTGGGGGGSKDFMKRGKEGKRTKKGNSWRIPVFSIKINVCTLYTIVPSFK